MIEHLNSEHNGNFEIEKKTFGTEKSFEVWRAHLEKETNGRFSVVNNFTLKKANASRQILLCNRDGHYKKNFSEPRQRAMKVQGSCKLNDYCTAYMIVNISHDNKVEVEFCLTHSHPIELPHIPISKIDKAKLKQKIENAVPLSSIIDSNRIDPFELSRKGELNLESRSDLITKQDLRNIKNCYCSSERRDDDDLISTQLIMLETPDVIFMKAQKHEEEGFAIDDFFLVYQSNFQKEILQEEFQKSQSFISIDSTHDTNLYGFYLITLITIGKHREGFPVAFCVSNKGDTSVLTKFLIKVKENISEPDKSLQQIKYFMSDMAPAGYNAWCSVFSIPAHRFWCDWHVNRAWIKNLCERVKDSSLKNDIKKKLYSIKHQSNKEVFDNELTTFLEYLVIQAHGFYVYFTSNYAFVSNYWAQYARSSLSADGYPYTNMHLESFHNILKRVYNHGKGKKQRVDALIRTLSTYLRDKMYDRKIADIYGGKHTKHTNNMHTLHVFGQSVDQKSIKKLENEDCWFVTSSKDASVTRTIYKTTHDCECPSTLKCKECLMCTHYKCTCENPSLSRGLLCKHIHAVGIYYPPFTQNELEIPEDHASSYYSVPPNNLTLSSDSELVATDDIAKKYKHLYLQIEGRNLNSYKTKMLLKYHKQIVLLLDGPDTDLDLNLKLQLLPHSKRKMTKQPRGIFPTSKKKKRKLLQLSQKK